MATDPFKNYGSVIRKRNCPSKNFNQARDRYTELVNQMKANIRDVPLESLVQLAKEGYVNPDKIPEIIPEKKVAIFAAKREIHRRAFKDFTLVPTRKCDPSGLGFLRKPTF